MLHSSDYDSGMTQSDTDEDCRAETVHTGTHHDRQRQHSSSLEPLGVAADLARTDKSLPCTLVARCRSQRLC